MEPPAWRGFGLSHPCFSEVAYAVALRARPDLRFAGNRDFALALGVGLGLGPACGDACGFVPFPLPVGESLE
jgi:hypothetical protein